MRRTAHAPSARNRPTLMVGLSGPLLPLFVVVFAASAFWPAGSAAQNAICRPSGDRAGAGRGANHSCGGLISTQLAVDGRDDG